MGDTRLVAAVAVFAGIAISIGVVPRSRAGQLTGPLMAVGILFWGFREHASGAIAPEIHGWEILLAGSVAAPIATFVHELGHALATRSFTDSEMELQVGRGHRGLKMEIPHLGFRMNFAGLGSGGGWLMAEMGLTTLRQRLVIVMAGPAASLLAVGVTAVLIPATSTGSFAHLVWISVGLESVVGVLNLFPFQLRGGDTDGMHVARLLQGARLGVPLDEPLAPLLAKYHKDQSIADASIPPPGYKR